MTQASDKQVHPTTHVHNNFWSIAVQLGEIQPLLMHTQGVLFNLSYLSLFQLTGKEMPQESLFKIDPIRMWYILIFSFLPMV